MGFYIRKSFRIGLVRLNLSKSGLGVSTGVRGFRLGMNGRGTYVHMGRGGLYYRKQLSWNSRVRSGAAPHVSSPPPTPIVEAAPSGIYHSEDLAQALAVTSASADDKAILAHFRQRREWSWLIVVCALAGLYESLSSATLAIGWSAVALGLLALRVFQAQRAVLIYDLDDAALERYQAFVEAFAAFFRSQNLWLYEQRSLTSDWKRNAGATQLMKRRSAIALTEGDPKVRTNLSIPCLSSGEERIHFLPDLIVVRQGAALAAHTYESLSMLADTEIFIEEGRAPSDAQVVGYAWRYSNRDGGPDRRFNDNRQLPRCRYQAVQVTSGGFRRSYSKSSIRDFSLFAVELRRLGELMTSLRQSNNSTPLAAPIVT